MEREGEEQAKESVHGLLEQGSEKVIAAPLFPCLLSARGYSHYGLTGVSSQGLKGPKLKC